MPKSVYLVSPSKKWSSNCGEKVNNNWRKFQWNIPNSNIYTKAKKKTKLKWKKKWNCVLEIERHFCCCCCSHAIFVSKKWTNVSNDNLRHPFDAIITYFVLSPVSLSTAIFIFIFRHSYFGIFIGGQQIRSFYHEIKIDRVERKKNNWLGVCRFKVIDVEWWKWSTKSTTIRWYLIRLFFSSFSIFPFPWIWIETKLYARVRVNRIEGFPMIYF